MNKTILRTRHEQSTLKPKSEPLAWSWYKSRSRSGSWHWYWTKPWSKSRYGSWSRSN
jgi:hypothetical protein